MLRGPWSGAAVRRQEVCILAGEYKCEEKLVSATVSMTTLFSIATLIAWMFVLAAMFPLFIFR